MLGTSDAWSMNCVSHRPIQPVYYIEDCRIFTVPQCFRSHPPDWNHLTSSHLKKLLIEEPYLQLGFKYSENKSPCNNQMSPKEPWSFQNLKL